MAQPIKLTTFTVQWPTKSDRPDDFLFERYFAWLNGAHDEELDGFDYLLRLFALKPRYRVKAISEPWAA